MTCLKTEGMCVDNIIRQYYSEFWLHTKKKGVQTKHQGRCSWNNQEGLNWFTHMHTFPHRPWLNDRLGSRTRTWLKLGSRSMQSSELDDLSKACAKNFACIAVRLHAYCVRSDEIYHFLLRL